jgi:amino acid adenylation domain-containing protein/thioester reductase-like protein
MGITWRKRVSAATTLLERLIRTAATSPEAEAIVVRDGVTLSFRDLMLAVRQHASTLRTGGAGPGSIVGLGCERSAEFVIGMFASWWVGAAYLPIDDRWPDQRIAFIVGEAKLALATAAGPLADRLRQSGVRVLEPPSNTDGHSAPHATRPDDLAYIIYTSGSTGWPKGVLCEHRGLTNLCDAQIPAFQLEPGRRALWLLSPAFDASVSDICTALTSGATLVIEPEPDWSQLPDGIRDQGITNLDLPPALLGVIDPAVLPDSLQTVVIGGEAALPELVRKWARRFRVVNVYGPTEATVCTSLCICDPITWDEPLLGRPIPGIEYAVSDEDGRPVRQGELWIAGTGLARGYLNRPDLTAAKFLLRDGQRWYRTGDRVRRRPDGELVFRGRLDRQFKLRGQLVEPEEIETCLRERTGVSAVAVVKRELRGREAIVAFVVAEGVTAEDMRAHVCRRLPPWLVPDRFEFVAALPRTGRAKVDHAELADRELSSVDEPSLPIEDLSRQVAMVWRKVLGSTRGRVDSLAALQLAAALAAEGIDAPPGWIAEGLSARELSHRLRSRNASMPANAIAASVLEADAAAVLATLGAPHARSLPATAPATILLTGATGFFGSWLLRELISRTTAEIICVVRAADDATAATRLGKVEPAERVRVVAGDLALPMFGWPAARWNELVGQVDSVYHAAAGVNMILPYAELRAANLIGTGEMLRFLAAGRPKRMHYLSTLSVFVQSDRWQGVCREDDDLTCTRWVAGGYAATKWAAARLIQQAAGRFGPVAHYRLGLITGDTKSGRTPGHDAFSLFLRGIAAVGGIPNFETADRSMDVTPVDYAAAALATISMAPQADGATFHVANPRPLTLSALVAALREFGFRLPVLDESEWRARLIARSSPTVAAAALGLVTGSECDIFRATGVVFDQTNARAGLVGSGLVCPDAGPELLRTYLAATFPQGPPR